MRQADKFDDIKASYKVYNSYSEQVVEYFDKNEREDFFITLAIPVFYQTILTGVKDKIGYKLAKPLLKIPQIESYIDDKIKITQSPKTYDEYKENTKIVKVSLKGVKAVWESGKYVLDGTGDLSGS